MTKGSKGFTKKMENELNKIIKKNKDQGAVIPILQAIQNNYGYLSRASLKYVSEKKGIPLSQLYGVATFYTQFSLHPSGKCTIRCCKGTACYVGGAESIITAVEDELGIEVGGTTEDMKFSLHSVACVGSCGLAPVIMIQDKAYGRLDPARARRVINKVSKEIDKK